jgi:hypothetical protein
MGAATDPTSVRWVRMSRERTALAPGVNATWHVAAIALGCTL